MTFFALPQTSLALVPREGAKCEGSNQPGTANPGPAAIGQVRGKQTSRFGAPTRIVSPDSGVIYV
jgi:hypothetical protein